MWIHNDSFVWQPLLAPLQTEAGQGDCSGSCEAFFDKEEGILPTQTNDSTSLAPLTGWRIAFYTLGCKLNFAETSTLAAQLVALGAERHAERSKKVPRLCVVNSCTVTDTAEKKCRGLLRRLHRRYPQALLVVTGCYAQLRGEELLSLPGVALVVGAGRKQEIAPLIVELVRKHESVWQPSLCLASLSHHKQFEAACSQEDRTRFFLKVQDGCNYFCSYCAIPFARGRSRNAPISHLVEQAEQVADSGGKELVLTGVNIGDFGRSTQETLVRLLQALTQVEGLQRIRIGSVEPDLLSQEIIELVAANPKLMPHFHIPLQAGSDAMLQLMRRHYDTTLFAEKVYAIKALIPDAFIGIDVIAGMRGETEALFAEGYQFISQLPFSALHVFPYSERQGTRALSITPEVSSAEKHRRTQLLLALSTEKLSTFVSEQIGTSRSVLWEHRQRAGEYMYGFTDNYIRLSKPYDHNWVGKVEEVVITSAMVEHAVSRG